MHHIGSICLLKTWKILHIEDLPCHIWACFPRLWCSAPEQGSCHWSPCCRTIGPPPSFARLESCLSKAELLETSYPWPALHFHLWNAYHIHTRWHPVSLATKRLLYTVWMSGAYMERCLQESQVPKILHSPYLRNYLNGAHAIFKPMVVR